MTKIMQQGRTIAFWMCDDRWVYSITREAWAGQRVWASIHEALVAWASNDNEASS